MTAVDPHRTIDAVWRMESPRLIAGLARITRDVGAAEDLAQDALVAALEKWPTDGIPDNPGAWLMTTARHRAIDRMRHRQLVERKHEAYANDLEADASWADPEAGVALDDDIEDDLLRLVFTACHPVLSTEARVALTLRMVGGLTTPEIARAYLVPEATLAQRIVRAKKTLAKAQVPFELPGGDERAERLDSVLEVIYLIFNEGYAASAGDDWMRPALCEDALRVGRVLAGLMPDEAEVHGLLALMELQASRMPARTAADGAPILLADQQRGRWDRLAIQRGLRALERAQRLEADIGTYTLQAAIAACHARAPTAEATDWSRIAALYGTLVDHTGSPVVELNRAVAVGMSDGPAAALPLIDALADEPVLAGYHLLPTVRGDLLEKLARHAEAAAAFEQAGALAQNAREQTVLRERAARCRRAIEVGAQG